MLVSTTGNCGDRLLFPSSKQSVAEKGTAFLPFLIQVNDYYLMLFGVDFDYVVDGHSQSFGCFYFGDLPALGFEPTGGCKALTGVAGLVSFLSASLGHCYFS